MKKKKQLPDYFNKLYPILLIFATIFMGIGYASNNQIALTIKTNAKAKAQTGVIISEVKIIDKNEAIPNLYDATGTLLHTNINLSDTKIDSYITYEITLINASSKDCYYTGYSYDESFYSNKDITFEVSNISEGDILNKNKEITLRLTFRYIGETIPAKTELDSYISFNFDKYYSVTYTNITNNGYPTNVKYGETLNIDFGNNAPKNILLYRNGSKNTNFTYTNGVLNVPNIKNNIEIEGAGLWVLTTDNNNNRQPDIGDEITFASRETFYVISKEESDTSEKLKLLTKYNLNVGNYIYTSHEVGYQSENAIGSNSRGIGWDDINGGFYGTLKFSDDKYWGIQPINTYVYSEKSYLKQYIDLYKNNLIKLGATDIETELIDIDQVMKISNYSFYCNTTYWTGSTGDDGYMTGVFEAGCQVGNASYNINNVLGIRPVVVLPIEQYKKIN